MKKIAVHLPSDVKALLDALSASQGRKTSDMARYIITLYVTSRVDEEPPIREPFNPPRVVTTPGASLSDKLEQSFNVPAPPWNLPEGSEYLAAAGVWRTPFGDIWDQNGPRGGY